MRVTNDLSQTQFADVRERVEYYSVSDENLLQHPFVKQIAKEISQCGGDVLDIGCGSGALSFLLGAGCTYWGGDFEVREPRILGDTERVATVFPLDACRRFPFEECKFDFVVSLWCVEHLAEPRTMLDECARILKPGGELLLVFPNYDNPLRRCPSYWCEKGQDDSLRSALFEHKIGSLLTQLRRRFTYVVRQTLRQLRISCSRRYQEFWINDDPAIRYLPWARDRDAIHIVSGQSVERFLQSRGFRIESSSRRVISGIPVIDAFFDNSPEYIIRAIRETSGNPLVPVAVPQSQSKNRDNCFVRVAHSGKQHSYRHALAVERCGALDRFITSGYYKPDVWPDRWLSQFARLDSVLLRRFQTGIPSAKIVRRWRFELPELFTRVFVGPGSMADKCVFRRDANFDRWVAKNWVRDCDVYWGFQGSCLESLRTARKRRITALAEFATAHVTKAIEVLSRESERHPEWASTISNFYFPDWYRERLEQEPHEADVCIAASRFTKRSLEDVGVESSRIQLLPLGADVNQFHFLRRTVDGPFRILFVGGVGQRKGIKYLLRAYDQMRGPGVELTVAGPLPADMRPLAPYQRRVRLTGRLDQSEIVREMHQAHVLVLPSVFEGFGLVIVEAMATGMPVIASTHSAGPDIIREGHDGFVLEPDDVDGLVNRLEVLRSDRNLAVEMGVNAKDRAREFSWDAHRQRVEAILGTLSGKLSRKSSTES